jgi:tetrahydromethanopterin S-methyltransferase subunit G
MTAQPWEPRVARLEGAYEQVDRRLESIDRRLESLDGKIDGLRGDLTKKIDVSTWQTTSLIFGAWVTIMLAILFHKL